MAKEKREKEPPEKKPRGKSKRSSNTRSQRKIPEREQQIQETLHESEDRYRVLAEQSLMGLVIVQDFRIVFANVAYAKIYGYTIDELLSLTPEEVEAMTHPEDQALVWGRFRDRLAGKTVPLHYEYRGVRKDGTVCWLEIHANRIEYGGKPAVQGAIIDITERKRAEESLKHLNLTLRAIRNINQLIAKRTDRDSLLKGACENFVKTRGYFNAWIALLDESGKLVTAVEAGLGKNFLQIIERLKSGELPDCARKALKKSGAVIIKDPSSACIACPLAESYSGRDGMSIQLQYGGKAYGLMTVSIPLGIAAKKEEQELFEEVSADIAFALYSTQQEDERKQAEEALRQSEERYRTVLEEMEEGYYEVDTAGNFTFVNNAMSRMLGYSRDELIGMNYEVYISKEEVKAVFEAYNRVYRTGEKLKWFPMAEVRKDETRMLVEDSVLAMRNAKGEVVGFRGVSRDVTERKKAEEALKKSEERYRQLAENAGEAIFVIRDGVIKFMNPKGAELSRYSIEEMVSKPFVEFIHPDDVALVADRYAMRLKGESVPQTYDFRIVRKDGDIRWGELNAVPISWEDQPAVLCFMNDITERKKAEEALRQSEERYRTILEEMEDSYFEVDLGGHFTFVNSATCRALGYSREEIIGMSYKKFTTEDDIQGVLRTFRAVYQTGTPNKGFSWKIIRKDGIEGYVEASASPLRNDKGEIIGFRGVGRDITERIKMEEQLILTDRLASVGQLAAGIAHELNNPLTAVIGFSDLLLERDLPPDVKADLQTVNQEAKRAVTIVKGLLAFAREQRTEKSLVNINSIIQGVLQIRSYEQKVSNIEVAARLAPDLPQVMGNGVQLQQVFINIIVNAEQVMIEAHGRGKLTIVTEQVGDTIRASISDDGPGISPDHMRRLFTPFFTTRDVGKGTGLGLSICHGIVTEHGGKIYAESELGKGATFVVELPIANGKERK